MTTIACGMAAIPSRYAHAEKTVRQFLADERVTSFTLYCDSYDLMPSWVYDLPPHRDGVVFNLERPAQQYPLLGDRGKSLCMSPVNERADIYVMLDDDLDYPDDYLDNITTHCTDESPIVSHHGVDFVGDWLTDPQKGATTGYVEPSERRVYHFANRTLEREVHLGGTGVMAIRRSVLDPMNLLSSLRLAAYPNMLDVHIAVQAAWAGIPIKVLAHEAGWIKQGVADQGIFERREEDPIKNELSIAMIKYLLKLRRER